MAIESTKWNISQVKGSHLGDVKDADNFTCIEFDESGEYLAVGDKSGRITVFHGSAEGDPTYNVFCAFTSHEPEFDYLKSLEIEEKINAICWLPTVNNSLLLLTTNDKVIKMWRISEQNPSAYNFNLRSNELSDDGSDHLSDADGSHSEKRDSVYSNNNPGELQQTSSSSSLRIPRYKKTKKLTIEVRPRRVYANAHTYHINSISVNSDQETFLSADDLRINLWHLDLPNQSFTIVDIKPENMEELSEVITCSRFHPELCNIIGYSTSRGSVRLCDMRVGALCDNYVRVLQDTANTQNRCFFGDIISSLSDFRFDHSGNCILARDYLNLKVWDIRKCDQPCEVYSVHEPLRSQLCMLYESDSIFDKFLCSWSDDDRYVLTGTYSNILRIFDRTNGTDWVYDLGEPGVRPSSSSTTTSASSAIHFFPSEMNTTSSASDLRSTPPPPLSLRSPWGARLQPKGFIAPDSDLAAQYRLNAVYVANSASIEATPDPISNPQPSTSSSTTAQSVPVSAGSKRRKQTLLPPRATGPERDDDEEDVVDDDEEENRADGDEEGSWDSDSSSEGRGRRANGSVSAARQLLGQAATNNNHVLLGLREMDYKRKFMHVTWHPSRPFIVSSSGNEIFFCTGEQMEPSALVVDEAAPEVEVEASPASTLPLGSPLDIKAAKRRRRRPSIDGVSDAPPIQIPPPHGGDLLLGAPLASLLDDDDDGVLVEKPEQQNPEVPADEVGFDVVSKMDFD